MLSFIPETEEKLLDLLEKGDGNYEVIKAENTTSQKGGNPMIKLTLQVRDKQGKQGIIYDYLVLNNTKFSLLRIRHFCFSCGLEENYNVGRLDASDCMGRQGKLVIGRTSEMPLKNTVQDYIVADQSYVAKPVDSKNSLPEVLPDDEIPF